MERLQNKKGRKFPMKPRLFLVLSWLSFGIFVILVLGLNYLVFPRLFSISKLLPTIFGIVSGLIVVIVGGGLFLLTLTSLTGLDLLYPHNKKQITVRVLFPIVTLLGTLLRLHPDKLRASYVGLNNSLLRAMRKRIRPKRILLLLPHCLQWSECPQRITWDINNCKLCGRCIIATIRTEFMDKFTKISIATGGSVARKVVVEVKPELVIAVACERDLVSGINDAYPIPVYGIPNIRPYGPCYNTTFEKTEIERTLEFFANSKLDNR